MNCVNQSDKYNVPYAQSKVIYIYKLTHIIYSCCDIRLKWLQRSKIQKSLDIHTQHFVKHSIRHQKFTDSVQIPINLWPQTYRTADKDHPKNLEQTPIRVSLYYPHYSPHPEREIYKKDRKRARKADRSIIVWVRSLRSFIYSTHKSPDRRCI